MRTDLEIWDLTVQSLPMADAVPAGIDKEQVAAQVRRKFSGALANDSKWNALIEYVRGLQVWRPSFRSKWVSGHISQWDTEWFYHLPFPFVGVEWFDMGLHQHMARRGLSAAQRVDHTSEIIAKLAEIGFEYEVRADVARIWGYYPKSCEDFPPGAQGTDPWLAVP